MKGNVHSNLKIPLFLVFLMVTMSLSSTIDNQADISPADGSLSEMLGTSFSGQPQPSSPPLAPSISYAPNDLTLTNNFAMATHSPTNTGGAIGTFSTVIGFLDATLDSTGDVGMHTSIASDSNDDVHISYYDYTNYDLKYATDKSGSWVYATLDSSGAVGYGTSIAVDSNNDVHISYFDNTNDDLKYATDKSGSWVTSTLDSTGSVGHFISIAIDSNDAVHISYYDFTNGDLKYATDKSGSWVYATLDSTGDVGWYTSIALDSNDAVHISYYDTTNDDLKYATDKSGSWVYATLDSSGDVGRSTSIAVDSNDAVHISYYDNTNGDLKYATDKSGSWVITTLDSSGNVGWYSSIALDSNDAVHISYNDDTNNDLKYATDKSGSWVYTTLDSTGYVGNFTFIALDSNDTVHISYRDSTNTALKYGNVTSTIVDGFSVSPSLPQGLSMNTSTGIISGTPVALQNRTMFTITATNAGGTSTTYVNITVAGAPNITYSPNDLALTNNSAMSALSPTNTGGAIGTFTTVTGFLNTSLESTGNVGTYTSIAFDSNDAVHISYGDASNIDLKYATNESGSWVYTTLDSTGYVGQYTSIALDSNNDVHISYYDFTNKNLKYATDKSGSWVYATLESTGDVGQYTSIAIDSNDDVHISYYDNTNDYLKYATDKSGSWVLTTLDSTGNVGFDTSITIDSNNDVHISYYDFTNAALKYATDKSGSWVYATLDSTGDMGWYTSIAVDSNNDVHISYLDYTNSFLKYATNESGSWVYATLDSTGYVGSYTSIALDSNDAVHISYRDATNSALKYATDKSSSWVYTTLDSTGNVAYYTSIALDSNDVVHISYRDSTNSALKYGNVTSTTTFTGGFSVSPSLPQGLSMNNSTGNISGTPLSLQTRIMYTITATNSNGFATTTINITVNDITPNIAYSPNDLALTNNSAMPMLSPTNTGGTIGTFTTVTGYLNTTLDSTGVVGRHTSIAYDSNVAVHISYYDVTNGDLKYATDKSGSWITLTLDSTGFVGQYTSIAIDSNDAVHISYYTPTGKNLKYATDKSGSWVTSTLESSGNPGLYTSIAVDSNDAVHISYFYYDGINWDLKYATDKSSSWVNSTIDSTGLGGSGIVGQHSSIALDSNDNIYISYYDTTNGDLKYATDKGGSWVNTTLDSAGNVGEYTSIAIDSNDAVHISYFDVTNRDLKYATDKSGSWVTSTLDSTGYVGQYTSIALDSNDDVHISYYDYINSDLKYATDKSGSWVATTLDSSGNVGQYSSIAVDSNADVHISYYDSTNSSLKYGNVTSTTTFTGGFSVSPTLPQGLSMNNSTGNISGTPFALQNRTMYTITATNSGGFATTTINITINDIAPNIAYSPNDLTLTNNSAMPMLSPTNTDGQVVSWSISPALSQGLVLNTSTGNISGTPLSLQTRTMYTITATNSGGTSTTYINITVNDITPNIAYSPNDLTLTNNSVMSMLSPTNPDGQVVSWSISPALSQGLVFNTTNGHVSGTPTALLPLTMYTITATNSGGISTVYVNITVNDELATLSYLFENLTLTRDVNMAPFISTTGGGAVLSWTISPELPTGLFFGDTNGSIWGTSTANMTQTLYTVLGNNSGGTVFTTFNLTVIEPLAMVTYALENITLTRSILMPSLIPELGGGFVTTWEIEPSLPSGLTLSNGVILGTPLVNSTKTIYTIWANNTGGSVSSTVNITIVEPVGGLVYEPQALILTRNVLMSSLNPTLTTGSIETWEVAPMLPAGLSFDNGTVSGTPSVNLSLTTFTVWANNSGGSSMTTFTIVILEPVPVVSYVLENLTLIRGEMMVTLDPTLSVGMVESWSTNSSLPDGLVFDNGSFSGTPLENSSFTSYTVRAQNSGGIVLVILNITIVEPVPLLSLDLTQFTITRDNTTMAVQVNNSGGMVEYWQISPSLPAGLAMKDGFVSGIATENHSEVLYTIWGNNSGGSSSVTFTLTVEESAVVVIPPSSDPDQELESKSNLAFIVAVSGLLVAFLLFFTLSKVFDNNRSQSAVTPKLRDDKSLVDLPAAFDMSLSDKEEE